MPAGFTSGLAPLVNASLRPGTLKTYNNIWQAYQQHYQAKLQQYQRGPLDVYNCIAYLLHLWNTNKSSSLVVLVIATFNHQRAIADLPSISDNLLVGKIKKAFAKRKQKFQSKFPTQSLLDDAASSVTSMSDLELLYTMGFLLCSLLGLRSGELWMLKPEYFEVEYNVLCGFNSFTTLTFPGRMLGFGVKSGAVREVFPMAAKVVRWYTSTRCQPFVRLDRTCMNRFLQSKFHCALNSARHIGANLVLAKTGEVGAVARMLGHKDHYTAHFYIDQHFPALKFSRLTKAVSKEMTRRCINFYHASTHTPLP